MLKPTHSHSEVRTIAGMISRGSESQRASRPQCNTIWKPLLTNP